MLYLQVDCAGVSLLMTGSPHTSMPYAMHHFKPRPLAGVFLCSGRTVMFRMNGISRVSTWMCGAIVSVMFRMNGMPRAQEAQERRVSVSYGVSLPILGHDGDSRSLWMCDTIVSVLHGV